MSSQQTTTRTQVEATDRTMGQALMQALKHWMQRDGGALLLFGGMAMVCMYPILTSLNTQMLGWLGDNVQYVYMTGWVAEAIQRGWSPFLAPNLNYPDGLSLAATDAPFLNLIAVSPITLLWSPVAGYNSLLYFTHFLSGYFAYLWIRHLTGSRFGGIIAGLAFMLTPYRIAHSYGHLQLVSTHFLPLFFWALDSALQMESPSGKKLLWLMLATFLIASGSAQYYLVICLVCGVVYAIASRPNARYLVRSGWRLVLAVGAGTVAGTLPYLATLRQSTYVPYSVAEARFWSADLFDFLIPSRLHPIWGATVERLYPNATWVEQTLYFGIVTSLLAISTLILARGVEKRRALVWTITLACGIVLALGTDLHVAGKPLQPANPIWLPAYYLLNLPFLSLLRVWSRAVIVPLLFLSLLAGTGAALLQRKYRWNVSVMVLVIALLVVDLVPGRLVTSSLQPRPIDDWLGRQPGVFAVAFLPAGVDNYQNMYGSLFHDKRLPAYNHPKHLPEAFQRFAADMQDFPSTESLDAGEKSGFRYLFLNRDAFDGEGAPPWTVVATTIQDSDRLDVIGEIDGFTIVELTRQNH